MKVFLMVILFLIYVWQLIFTMPYLFLGIFFFSYCCFIWIFLCWDLTFYWIQWVNMDYFQVLPVIAGLPNPYSLDNSYYALMGLLSSASYLFTENLLIKFPLYPPYQLLHRYYCSTTSLSSNLFSIHYPISS